MCLLQEADRNVRLSPASRWTREGGEFGSELTELINNRGKGPVGPRSRTQGLVLAEADPTPSTRPSRSAPLGPALCSWASSGPLSLCLASFGERLPHATVLAAQGTVSLVSQVRILDIFPQKHRYIWLDSIALM